MMFYRVLVSFFFCLFLYLWILLFVYVPLSVSDSESQSAASSSRCFIDKKTKKTEELNLTIDDRWRPEFGQQSKSIFCSNRVPIFVCSLACLCSCVRVFVFLSVCLFVSLTLGLFMCQPIFVCLYAFLSFWLSLCQRVFVCLYVLLYVCLAEYALPIFIVFFNCWWRRRPFKCTHLSAARSIINVFLEKSYTLW